MSDSPSENKMLPLIVGGIVVIGLIVFGAMKSRNSEPVVEPPPPPIARSGNSKLAGQAAPAPAPVELAEPGGLFVTKAELRDAGLGSPEKALRTYLAAVLENDFDRMAAAMTPEKAQEFTNMMSSPALSGDVLVALTNTLVHQRSGFRIVDTKDVSEDEKIISVRFGAVNESSPTDRTTLYTLKKVAGEWKLAYNASAPLK